MYKVIYFDEGSATDFLQIYYGGNIEVVDEKDGKISYKVSGSIDGNAKVGKNFLSLIKASISLNGSANIEKSKDSILKSTITNTLLSDFVEFAKSDENNNQIDIFRGFKVDSINQSLTFLKMYSPYFRMFKEDTEYTKDFNEFNFIEVDDILKGAKGYYELLAINGNEKVILRFNINSFRNSYTLTDLTKMDLTYYAIKVGKCKLEDLLIENEFPKENDIMKKLTAEEIFNERMTDDVDDTNYTLNIYDVLLAGVDGDNE